MPKENEESDESTISKTGKAIKKGMDSYQAKMKSVGEEPPAGDLTRSEE